MIASVNENNPYVLRAHQGLYPSHTVAETLVTGVQNIPTDYTRYTASFTMPTGANTTDILEIGLSFYLFDGSTNINEDLFSISEMQLELGDTATPFEHRSYAEELTLCERYYETGTYLFSGDVTSGSDYFAQADFKVTKRASPSTSPSPISTNPGYGFTGGQQVLNAMNENRVQIKETCDATVSGGWFVGTYTADAEL